MLTDLQTTDVRRWLGYAIGSGAAIADAMAILTASEESTLVTRFLDPLATLEAAVLGASDNLDTKIAGPWTANPTEVSDRARLYDQWRRDMAAFLGFAPGPSLGGGGFGGVFLTRA